MTKLMKRLPVSDMTRYRMFLAGLHLTQQAARPTAP